MTDQTQAALDVLTPRIGQKVKIAGHVTDSEAWNTQDWFVAGLTTDIRHKGVNVWVAPEYPPTSEAPTDGFYANRWPMPDDLEWSPLQPRPDSGAEKLLREARWYVADALESHEHSDGREILTRIDAHLTKGGDYALAVAANWQPIETVPRDGSRILGGKFSNPDIVGEVSAIRWNVPGEYWEDHGFQYCTEQPDPTHWMPLPPPPKDDAS